MALSPSPWGAWKFSLFPAMKRLENQREKPDNGAISRGIRNSRGGEMSFGARVFVAIIYFLLGLSFVATTAVLYYEFRDAASFSMAVIYSHVFVFFPIFGIVALFAFYLPSSIFVDLYWNHIPYGRYRFAFGFVVSPSRPILSPSLL